MQIAYSMHNVLCQYFEFRIFKYVFDKSIGLLIVFKMKYFFYFIISFIFPVIYVCVMILMHKHTIIVNPCSI